MNRMLVLIICFSGALFAEDSIIMLESLDQHGKTLKKDIVMISKDEVMVNKEKLSATEVITQSEHIRRLSTFPKVTTEGGCGVGIFKHILKKGKISKKEEGCLGSPRYEQLKLSFKNLKKDKVTD